MAKPIYMELKEIQTIKNSSKLPSFSYELRVKYKIHPWLSNFTHFSPSDSQRGTKVLKKWLNIETKLIVSD